MLLDFQVVSIVKCRLGMCGTLAQCHAVLASGRGHAPSLQRQWEAAAPVLVSSNEQLAESNCVHEVREPSVLGCCPKKFSTSLNEKKERAGIEPDDLYEALQFVPCTRDFRLKTFFSILPTKTAQEENLTLEKENEGEFLMKND